SSMLRDLRAAQRADLDTRRGAVVALAERHGAPAPLNTALLTLIRAAETRA
ncbi:MAG: 2-dehydropantoate 2-reductase, partial [bacterium]|nr:2-dehydropantoate 2-reductase [bacterium]